MKKIRIGGALGYWGDRRDAVGDLLRGGPLDYVMMDYLSEVTMSILQKQREKTPDTGFAHDFVSYMKHVLPGLRKKGVKLATNAGGLDPLGCARALQTMAKEGGIQDLKIGVVTGDDILARLPAFEERGVHLKHMETGQPKKELPGQILTANAYLGAFPIAEAFAKGAEIVITGRVNDAALTLAPCIHEFGWKPSDYDRLARGTIAGHLLECGGQASGGNFNGGWKEVPNLADLAFPIAEVSEDGTFDVFIHPGQGGLVTPAVLKEQLLYEMMDPGAYLVADVSCDINALEMEQIENNRVRITGIRGQAPTDTYKVSLCFEGAYRISMGLVYEWPECVAKARAGADLLLGRLKKLKIPYKDHRMSIFGYDGVHGPMARKNEDPDEVYLRMTFLVDDAATAEKIAREMATHVVCGIPTACGLDIGRASPQRQVKHWPTLVPKSLVETKVEVL